MRHRTSRSTTRPGGILLLLATLAACYLAYKAVHVALALETVGDQSIRSPIVRLSPNE